MLVGYVSDENYLALSGVQLEFEQGERSTIATSRVSGAIHADLETGACRVALSHPGYGAKRVDFTVDPTEPYHFRLLSGALRGFMWPTWTTAGEISEYCVHSQEAFKLDLFRYSWQKEFVRSYGWCDEHGPGAMQQILPDGDFVRSGVHWNSTGYTLEFQKHGITAPSRSGLYFFHAKTLSGQFCGFPWIVSPTSATAPIAVLASTMTWNAYNSFGGRSNYFSQAGLADTPTVNSRQDLGRYTQPDTWPYETTSAPLSFQRPQPAHQVPEESAITDPIAGRLGSALAPGLWRLMGWLDRENFASDLYSDTALELGQLDLKQYRVLILDNHPEYWTATMYQAIKQWVAHEGGTLLYLGGCAGYAEAELPDPNTQLCRREGHWNLRGDPPHQLLGIGYTHAGFQTAAPYRVLDASHWVFGDTGLANDDLFGQESLHERCPGGASAHELDTIQDGSPANLEHLAKGTNPEESGADLVIYPTESGGQVFSVGSLCWTLALPIDDTISTITANVLRRSLGD
jgi:N,N-dimethylformamidase